jgi:hypothetical protein
MFLHSRLLWIAALLVFFINIPFGYWRSRVRKFSRQWLLAIHIPVPFVVACRFILHLGWHFSTFPLLVGAFFAGQFAGGKLQRLIGSL